MSYNGVGGSSAKGTGLSGYIQRSRATVSTNRLQLSSASSTSAGPTAHGEEINYLTAARSHQDNVAVAALFARHRALRERKEAAMLYYTQRVEELDRQDGQQTSNQNTAAAAAPPPSSSGPASASSMQKRKEREEQVKLEAVEMYRALMGEYRLENHPPSAASAVNSSSVGNSSSLAALRTASTEASSSRRTVASAANQKKSATAFATAFGIEKPTTATTASAGHTIASHGGGEASSFDKMHDETIRQEKLARAKAAMDAAAAERVRKVARTE